MLNPQGHKLLPLAFKITSSYYTIKVKYLDKVKTLNYNGITSHDNFFGDTVLKPIFHQ